MSEDALIERSEVTAMLFAFADIDERVARIRRAQAVVTVGDRLPVISRRLRPGRGGLVGRTSSMRG